MLIPGLSWIQVGAGAIGAFIISYGLHDLDVSRLEYVHRTEMAKLQKDMVAACESQKKLTQEANDALQTTNEAIAAKLAAAKRLHPAHCVAIAGNLAIDSGGGPEHAGLHGISSDWLRDYAARCELYRSEVIVLNDFGHGERAQ